MALPSQPARSPTAPAPRVARAWPRAPAAARRPARESLRDEPVARRIGDVADFPALRLDRRTQLVGALEVAGSPSRHALLRQLDRMLRRDGGRRLDAEERERTPKL